MTNSQDFTPEQKRYLEGYVSGVQASRVSKRLPPIAGTADPVQTARPSPASNPAAATGPDAVHIRAQDRVLDAGGKLVAEETAKREEHPFDMYARMKRAAREEAFPKGGDVFRWKFHGLFYVAPAQNAFMCRMRIPNGILSAWQFRGVADLAERCGGGYADVTTRANLQIREIDAAHGIEVIETLQALGLTPRGSGADNIRNVTGSPLAGIDPIELIDTRPLASEWHYHILNDRSLYGLPRKFNVAFDGGGRLAVLEETNDIGFQAVRVPAGASTAVEPGVWFRLALGGITGHRDLARDTGIVLRPGECTEVADAIVRVFIDHGDRTNRTKARLKYLLDAWGFEKFMGEVETRLGRTLLRLPLDACAPRPPVDRLGHIGVHAQAQDGLSYIGVVLPVGRVTTAQMRAIADIAVSLGDGDIRLTVWQNLLLSGIPDARIGEAQAAIEAAGLDWRASSVRAGLVACTGNAGCRFAASDTKRHAQAIADHIDGCLALDTPINIHLTGCHNSCAQHYIGDIGLLGARVAVDEDGEETVEGYHVFIGGGYANDAALGREFRRDVKAEDVPELIERMLRVYLAQRADPAETFQQFSARFDIQHFQTLVDSERR
ncbi:Ferredoxin--nitrite reductase [uncultured Defluviicoccus sp.]|uniref:Ferredoxin--nitrite reductase n=1 Tax=metagenome TaxID=256318 RepID=A0A380TFS8_9ZZZZ|nr:Ferredoxin--nitrite reductase [uncultured Defluviicoccus sp.]